MARRDLFTDASSYAENELQHILKRQTDKLAGHDVKVTLDEALHAAPVAEHYSDRDITRVLFISQDTELLNPTKQTLDGYIDVSDMFDEVHIIVMRTGIQPRQPVFRPAPNVWIYTVATRYWWQLAKASRKIMEEQLLFADGFRPDLIVARDPRESALAALWASKTFGRPAQLHVSQKLSGKRTKDTPPVSFCRRLVARYTIPRFKSIRTASQLILSQVASHAKTSDIAVLPQHNPYEAIAAMRQTIDLKKTYPQYIFHMLCVTEYKDETALIHMLDGAHTMLQNKRISLIMVGDGPAKSLFKKRAKLLGVDQQIIYLTDKEQAVQYMLACELLLLPETDAMSEEIALQAAYASIAMIATTTERRADVFRHEESAYLCESATTPEFAAGIATVMNNYAMRVHLSEQARLTVQKQFHKDPEVYKSAYRASIESALFSDDQDMQEKTASALS